MQNSGRESKLKEQIYLTLNLWGMLKSYYRSCFRPLWLICVQERCFTFSLVGNILLLLFYCSMELIKTQTLKCISFSLCVFCPCPEYGAQATQCLPFPPSHPQQHHPQPGSSHSPSPSWPLGGCAGWGPSGRHASAECKWSDYIYGPDDDLISSDRTASTEHKDAELRDCIHSHRRANLQTDIYSNQQHAHYVKQNFIFGSFY